MATAFIFIISLSFFYTLFLQFFSLDKGKVNLFAKILLGSSLAGASGLIISSIVFYVHLNSVDNAEFYGTLRDAFNIFAVPIFIWTISVMIITLAVYFFGRKITAVIPSVCHLTSVLILLWTIIFASWAHFDGFSMNIYDHVFGCSLSLSVMLPASLTLKKLAKKLEDKNYVYSRLHRHDGKLKKAEERKRIKETKKRIKNGTK